MGLEIIRPDKDEKSQITHKDKKGSEPDNKAAEPEEKPKQYTHFGNEREELY